MAQLRAAPGGLALIVAGLGFVVAWVGGWSVAYNGSDSMPRGIYLLGPPGGVARGELVEACVPSSAAIGDYAERNYLPVRPGDHCASGLAHLVKPVVAVAGDLVSVEADQVLVNGQAIDAHISNEDRHGRALERVENGWFRLLEPGEYFIVSSWSPWSLDSRYFGPVKSADIQARAWRLITE